LDYSFKCLITSEGDGENDTANVTVIFNGAASDTRQTHPCDVAEQGTITNSITIPQNTTSVEFVFNATVVGTADTVKFNSLSFVVDDKTAPRLSLGATPETGGGATISVTASEGGSGLKSVYYASGDQTADYFKTGGTEVATTNGSGSFHVSSGGTYTVYTVDYRDNGALDTVYANTYAVFSGLSDQTTQEDTALSFSFNISDDGTSAGALTITAASGNTALIPNSSLSVSNTDGLVSVSLTPVADENGTAQLSFIVTDSDGLQSEASITVNVEAVNDVPVANADTAETNEESAVVIDVLANDTNPDNGTLTVEILSAPASGTALVNSDGTISFTPAKDFTGSISFTYQITDSSGGDTASATVTVTVDAVDDPPVAVNDSAEVTEDGSVTISVLANDSDIEGDAFFISSIGTPEHGTAVLSTDSTSIVYTPSANYFGSDSFSYSIAETASPSATATATVQVEITSVNDAPQPVYEASINTDEDTATIQSISATDIDGDALTFSVKEDNRPAHGTLEFGEGQYTYTPDADFTGMDSFTITVSDGTAEVGCAITVTVNPVNDLPVPTYQAAITTDEDTPATESLTATDVDGDTLTYSVKDSSGPAHGSLALIEGGYTYTPAADYYGSDSFTVTVSDGTGVVDCAISVTINSVNDAPVPTYVGNVVTNEDTPLSESLTATDVDGDTVSKLVKAGNEPDYGTLELTDGGYTYTPNADYYGTDSFTITVSDGVAEVDCAITVTVNPVNDAPLPMYTASVSTDEDTPLTESFTATDVDLDTLTYSVKESNEPQHGTLLLIDGGYTYTPVTNYHGGDTFTITVSDGTTEIDSPIAVTINSVNDAPVPTYIGRVFTNEDTPLSESLTATDVDEDTLSYSVKEGNSPIYGTLELTDGGYTYTPNADYFGTDSFTITVSDGTDEVDCDITVTVNPVNDAPVPAYTAAVSTDEDTPLTESFTATDVDLDALTYSVKDGNGPSNGTLELGTNSYTYTPAADYNGTDTFTITVSDGTVEVNGTITVTVNPVNDAPVPAYEGRVVTNEDTPLTETLTATDIDGDTLSYS
jgi:VCBS repeat-containing protein